MSNLFYKWLIKKLNLMLAKHKESLDWLSQNKYKSMKFYEFLISLLSSILSIYFFFFSSFFVSNPIWYIYIYKLFFFLIYLKKHWLAGRQIKKTINSTTFRLFSLSLSSIWYFNIDRSTADTCVCVCVLNNKITI